MIRGTGESQMAQDAWFDQLDLMRRDISTLLRFPGEEVNEHEHWMLVEAHLQTCIAFKIDGATLFRAATKRLERDEKDNRARTENGKGVES